MASDTPDELVHYVVDQAVDRVADRAVATVTLDSPHNRNALSRQLVTELSAALTRADQDPSVAVALLTSQGRVFCSGADLSEASTVPMEEGGRAIASLQRQIVSASKPVVVKLAGPVRAGGIGIVAAADVVIASDDASFALTEVKLGLTPAIISLTVLPRLTSRAAASTFLGGEVFDGKAAAAMGLVTRSVPADELDAAVAQVCAELATGSPQGLRETKALLAAELLPRFDERTDDLIALSSRLFASDEAREAMTAFLSRSR